MSRRFLGENGGGHLGLGEAGCGGHGRELAGGHSRRIAIPLHEDAPGRRDDNSRIAVGPHPGQFAPLPLHDR
jgi:hypothetical protein